jgi:hypothetical protein
MTRERERGRERKGGREKEGERRREREGGREKEGERESRRERVGERMREDERGRERGRELVIFFPVRSNFFLTAACHFNCLSPLLLVLYRLLVNKMSAYLFRSFPFGPNPF